MIIKKIYFFSFLFFLTSCSTTSGLKPRTVEEYYVSTGIERYFLPDIPEWANFSQSGGCFRTKGLRYFDIDALMKSYSLNFFEALQVQASFNEEFLAAKKSQGKETLTLKEDENIFFKASEKVGSKINFTNLPDFKRVHLIWVDEVIADSAREQKLKNFLNSSVHDEGVPVLVSACLTKSDLEKKFPETNIKSLSAELFSIYDAKGQKKPNLHINVDVFFKPEQKLFFYGQSIKGPVQDITGSYKIMNY